MLLIASFPRPAFHAKQIPHKTFRLAMSVGASPHYRILDIQGRHFVEGGKTAGWGPALMRQVLDEVMTEAATAPDRALATMPKDFHPKAYDAVRRILPRRLAMLKAAYEPVRRGRSLGGTAQRCLQVQPRN